ncbi:bifunctional metallophosphatase/5'-nucleotidase, partial [Streptosporangium sandarakinum]
MHSKKIAVLGMAGLTALAIPSVAHASAGKSVTVTVMGTSDLHGNTLNWDYFKNAEFDDGKGNDVGLAKVSTMVDKIRARRGS